MEPIEFDEIIGVALVFGIHTFVVDHFKKNPVRSSIISTSELILLHTNLLVSVLRRYLECCPQEQIEMMYNERIKFINMLVDK